MKRFFVIAVVACAALFVSCVSVEDKAVEYAEKLVNASWSEKGQVMDEMEAYVVTLSPEKQEAFEAAYKAELKRLLKSKMRGAAEQFVSGAEALMEEAGAATSAIVDEATKAVEDFSNKHGEDVEKAVNDAAEAAVEAAEAAAEKIVNQVENISPEDVEAAANEAAKAVEAAANEAAKAVEDAAKSFSSLFE